MQTTYPKVLGKPNKLSHGYGRSPFPYDLQTAAFGYPNLVVPHKPLPAELLTLPVAPHECAACTHHVDDETPYGAWVPTLVTPVLLSDGETWNPYPCHLSECACCFQVGTICGNCGKVEGECCDCAFCSHCDEMFDPSDVCDVCHYCVDGCSCYSCDYCGEKLGDYCDYWTSEEDGEPLCESCYERRRDDMRARKLTPGWVTRGWETDRNFAFDAERTFRKKYAKTLDPAQMMCDFYISDYVMAVLPAKSNSYTAQGTWTSGPDYGPDGHLVQRWTYSGMVCEYHDPSVQIRRDAKTLQDAIIAQCDEAFRHYAYMAIGGEVRHHGNVADATPAYGRNNQWAWWAQMGEQYGRIAMLEDAVALFCDPNEWQGGGYGGEKWAECARILLAREKGDLDPKTFVDRVFTLQHNGGSFLNKVDWAVENKGSFNTYHMQRIGNAHAAVTPDFTTLLQGGSSDAYALLAQVLPHMPEGADKDSAAYGLEWMSRYYGTPTEDAEQDSTPSTPTGDETGQGYISGCTCESCQAQKAAY